MATIQRPPPPPPPIKKRNSLTNLPDLGLHLFSEAHGSVGPNEINPILDHNQPTENTDHENKLNTKDWQGAWKKLHQQISNIKIQTEVVEEFQSAATKARKAVQLKNVVLELLETEKKYHEKLTSLVLNWQGPLTRWSQEQVEAVHKMDFNWIVHLGRGLLEADELAEAAKREAKTAVSKKTSVRKLRRSNSESTFEVPEGSSPPRPIQIPDSAVTEAEVRLIFGNSSELLSISENILKKLESVILQGCSDHAVASSVLVAIGDCFNDIEGQLHSYGSYLSTAETATNLLDKVQRRLVVKIFMDSCRHQVASLKGTSLSSLLIEPVQRLPRYQLLLRELIKYSCPGIGRDALSKGLKSVETVCAAINKDMADADMYQTLSRLSKVWGVDVLSRPNLASTEHQCLICGGGVFENHELSTELDTLPVLFVRGAKTKLKAEPVLYKALLTRDLLVLGNTDVGRTPRRFSFGPNNADMAQAIAAASAAANEDVFGGPEASSNLHTEVLKEKVKASAAINLSNKCLLVRGYNVMPSFKPLDTVTPQPTEVEGLTKTSDGLNVYNMLHLDSECSRIFKTSGIRAEDLARTNQNPDSCFLLLTEGLSFAFFPPTSTSDRRYSLKALEIWYNSLKKVVGDQQLYGV